MGYTNALTFDTLRGANLEWWVVEFGNRTFGALSAWCDATCGELSDTANLIKKIERGDMTLDEARNDLGRELADVVIYLDLLAFHAGIDLGEAVTQKFNEDSERAGSTIRISGDGWQRSG